MKNNFPKGVLTGNQVQELFQYAKQRAFALPAVNVVGSNSVNAVIETAAELNSPVIIQFSNGGSQFMAGKGMTNENQKAAKAMCVNEPSQPASGRASARSPHHTVKP